MKSHVLLLDRINWRHTFFSGPRRSLAAATEVLDVTLIAFEQDEVPACGT